MTIGVEGFFSLLKRGVIGTVQHVSEQHLPLYLAEFDHRHNTQFLTVGARTIIVLKKANGKKASLQIASLSIVFLHQVRAAGLEPAILHGS